jgi:hypothetical protein
MPALRRDGVALAAFGVRLRYFAIMPGHDEKDTGREPLTSVAKSGSIFAKGDASGETVRPLLIQEDPSMKLIVTLLGVVLLAVAAVYFLMPADQLPGFFPGHEAGVTRMHYKHGAVAGVVGLVLLVVGLRMGRR